MSKPRAKRVQTKIGNVFSVPLGDGTKKYFQCVAKDRTQLNSPVIRAFKRAYPAEAKPDLLEVVSDDVDFYAHVIIRWGIQMNLWEKVGNVPFYGELNAVFRDATDLEYDKIEKSEKWQVWKVNQDFQFVGKLEGDLQKAEIGLVVAPPDIVSRMRTRKYLFRYPGY